MAAFCWSDGSALGGGRDEEDDSIDGRSSSLLSVKAALFDPGLSLHIFGIKAKLVVFVELFYPPLTSGSTSDEHWGFSYLLVSVT